MNDEIKNVQLEKKRFGVLKKKKLKRKIKRQLKLGQPGPRDVWRQEYNSIVGPVRRMKGILGGTYKKRLLNFIRSAKLTLPEYTDFFHELFKHTAQQKNRNILLVINKELEENFNFAIPEKPKNKSRKRVPANATYLFPHNSETSVTSKKLHVQKRIYNRIKLNPEEFYAESREACLNRVAEITSGLNKFGEQVRPFAEFNIEFFRSLSKRNKEFKPIKLPNDVGYFRWPNTQVIETHQTAKISSIDAPDAGLLSVLGYNVQKNGPSEYQRYKILDEVFLSQLKIIQSLELEYVAEWGAPKSAGRLRKMAYSLASFSRQQKRKQNASQQAIVKWESDLEYLKKNYYQPFANEFNWPAL